MDEDKSNLVEMLAEYFTVKYDDLPAETQVIVSREFDSWDILSASQRAAQAKTKDDSKIPYNALIERCGFFFSNFQKFIEDKLISVPREEKTVLYELKAYTDFNKFIEFIENIELQSDSEDGNFSKIESSFFDKSNPAYSKGLDYAIKAWLAISMNNGKGTPKNRATKWLQNEKTGLTETAIKRVAGVVNWNKSGGAPKTE